MNVKPQIDWDTLRSVGMVLIKVRTGGALAEAMLTADEIEKTNRVVQDLSNATGQIADQFCVGHGRFSEESWAGQYRRDDPNGIDWSRFFNWELVGAVCAGDLAEAMRDKTILTDDEVATVKKLLGEVSLRLYQAVHILREGEDRRLAKERQLRGEAKC